MAVDVSGSVELVADVGFGAVVPVIVVVLGDVVGSEVPGSKSNLKFSYRNS